MSNMLKTVLIPAVICMFCLTACTTLPLKALYTDPIAADIAVDTVNSRFDVVYAIDCCVMPKPKDDFVSLKVNTMLCTYRFDFSMNYGMKNILDRFFTISAMADSQKRKNGMQYLGETTLYAYALSEDTLSRLVADGVDARMEIHRAKSGITLQCADKYRAGQSSRRAALPYRDRPRRIRQHSEGKA